MHANSDCLNYKKKKIGMVVDNKLRYVISVSVINTQYGKFYQQI